MGEGISAFFMTVESGDGLGDGWIRGAGVFRRSSFSMSSSSVDEFDAGFVDEFGLAADGGQCGIGDGNLL